MRSRRLAETAPRLAGRSASGIRRAGCFVSLFSWPSGLLSSFEYVLRSMYVTAIPVFLARLELFFILVVCRQEPLFSSDKLCCYLCACVLSPIPPACSTLYYILFRRPLTALRKATLRSIPISLKNSSRLVANALTTNPTYVVNQPPASTHSSCPHPPSVSHSLLFRVMRLDAVGARSSESRRSKRGKRGPSCCQTSTRSRTIESLDA